MCWDSASAPLVRSMMAGGELPYLASVAGEHGLADVDAHSDTGSGATWPTFSAGAPPAVHQISSGTRWQPEHMRSQRERAHDLVPFWSRLGQRGISVGLIDAVFTPDCRPNSGFELSHWGAHDRIHEGPPSVFPPRLKPLVDAVGPHPYARRPVRYWGDLSSLQGLREFGERSREGVRLRGELASTLLTAERPDLAIIVFPEVHRAGHVLWHGLDETHPQHEAAKAAGIGEALLEVYRETDRQLGRLLEALPPTADVVVFSLQGMGAGRGTPYMVASLLEAAGYAVEEQVGTASLRTRGRTLFDAGRRRVPQFVKRGYRRVAPRAVGELVAGPEELLPAYDWSRTIAFPLPADLQGWIRINLAGRERDGIVPRSEYEARCREIEQWLLALQVEDGRPVVRKVIRPALGESGPPRHLPDLVALWNDEALWSSTSIRGTSVPVQMRSSGHTGQHTPEGFIAWRAASSGRVALPERVRGEDLGELMLEAIGAR